MECVGPRAEVFVYVDVLTWLGLSDEPAEMSGHGVIPALALEARQEREEAVRKLFTGRISLTEAVEVYAITASTISGHTKIDNAAPVALALFEDAARDAEAECEFSYQPDGWSKPHNHERHQPGRTSTRDVDCLHNSGDNAILRRHLSVIVRPRSQIEFRRHARTHYSHPGC